MSFKLLIIFLALTGQALVKARPDSYSSEESLESLRHGSSEENFAALSSDEESNEEIPLFSYNPAKDGEPGPFFAKVEADAAAKGESYPPETLEHLKKIWKKYQGHMAKPLPEPTAEQISKIDLKLNKAEVKRHNEVRQFHDSPPVEYDEKLAAFAQNYAEKISAKMAQGYEFEHNPETRKYGIGENMAGDGPTEAVWDPKTNSFNWGSDTWKPKYDGHNTDMWYFTEIPTYMSNGNRPSPNNDPHETGHFTQVVWKGSQKVGCGMACYKNPNAGDNGPSKNCNVICNYSPAGNIQARGNLQKYYPENVNMKTFDMQAYEKMNAEVHETQPQIFPNYGS